MSTYKEQLRDPRWQKRRLEIMERDKWTCRKCESKIATLNVHHLCYLKKAAPWEYPDRLLITFCQFCHKAEEKKLAYADRHLATAVRFCGATNADLDRIATLISEIVRLDGGPAVVAELELTLESRWQECLKRRESA